MADKETIFITGGLGFVGSHLARRFLDHGDRVVIYDILKTYFSPLEDNLFHIYLRERHKTIGARAEIIQGDIRDYGRLNLAVSPPSDMLSMTLCYEKNSIRKRRILPYL